MPYESFMTETEQNILDALLELERTIEALPRTTPPPDLLTRFNRLDELTRGLPRTTDPTLLHYLHKKSYQKARLFLQERDAENTVGNCHGHVDEQGRPWEPQRPASGVVAQDGDGTSPAR
jgi:hypothetical protein